MPYNSCNFTIWANKRNIIQYLLFTKTFFQILYLDHYQTSMPTFH